MRKAARQKVRRGEPLAEAFTIPVPSRGWNAREAISAMKPTDALVLDNWTLEPGKIRIRPGRMPWVTGLPGLYVETLMEYAPAGGNPRLFAAMPSAIFDVSASGPAGAAILSGLANGRWSHVNFATAGGNYLLACNGADGVRAFDGTTWTTQGITGATPTAFATVTAHMNRLWFIEAGTRHVWYLGLQAITGPATLFDLSQLTPLGGDLAAMSTWTRDGGDGPDDYAAFITTKGEVLVYAGSDPASSATWSLVGRYKIAPPIGRRCTVKLGAELVILTTQGPLPMSQVMGLPAGGQTNASVTDRIAGAFSSAAAAAGGSFGWQMIEHPAANLLLVNVPVQERVAQQQFAFGTRTGGWSRFLDLNAGCWSRFGEGLFLGGNDGTVSKLDGTSDAGAPILATYQHAFTNLRTPVEKVFRLARPKLVAPPGYVPAVHVRTNYDPTPIDFRILATPDTSPVWDVAEWDTAVWGADLTSSQGWQTIEGVGDTVSIAFRVAATAALELNGTDVLYEAGAIL